MAIRFACPSCQQPIEIDDNWAGQSVACPYCRKVVTAPRDSNWPPQEIPVATPVRPGMVAPPPPPAGYAGPQIAAHPYTPSAAPAGTNSASWALLLSLVCTVLCIAAFVIWMSGIITAVTQQVGANASEQQIANAAREMMVKQNAPASPGAAATAFVGVFCGIAALALAIRALVRREQHTGLAIAACIIAAVFVFCQIILALGMLQHHMTGA